MTIDDEISHPTYGVGRIISITDELYTVRFDSPPGMSKDAPRARIVPVITFWRTDET